MLGSMDPGELFGAMKPAMDKLERDLKGEHRLEWIQAAISDALNGVCAETGGTRCRHIDQGAQATATDRTHGRVRRTVPPAD